MLPNFKLQEAFLDFLLNKGVVTEEDIFAAMEYRREKTPPVGRIALKEKMLTVRQVSRILMAQCDSGLPFGQQAVALGFWEPDMVDEILKLQRESRPSALAALLALGFLDQEQLEALRDEFAREAMVLSP